MTHDELITVARTHVVDFPKLSGEPWAHQEELNKVTVLETVMVSFENEQRPRKIWAIHGLAAREAQISSRSLRAKTCRLAKASGAKATFLSPNW